MILDVDMGNTRLKWRLRAEAKVVCRGAIMNNEMDALFTEIVSAQHRPLGVYVACVVPEHQAKFNLRCQQHWGLQPVYAVVEERYNGLINAYDDRSQMGVDRWLAMVAAYSAAQKPCVVIACGSAITVDVVAAQGRHLGGYIAPGIDLMRKALFVHTSRVKLDSIDTASVASTPGVSTRDAVASGLLEAHLGLVRTAIDVVKTACEMPMRIHITGGDGRRLLAALQQRTRGDASVEAILYTPELVLDGLSQVYDSKL
ncbi:MAG: type III pantothenate kinase [Cellvibrionaceae bacterium]|nr:type III pantothenate kinase [Cellvibrionaceae bacterium]